MTRRLLIEQCAPTLARIKPGSLFHYCADKVEDIPALTSLWDEKLKAKGIRICLMKEHSACALVYVYRPSMLSKLLSDPAIHNFLRDFGFSDWGDGQWMRDWQERCSDGGIKAFHGEGLIINETPDKNGLELCKEFGKSLLAD